MSDSTLAQAKPNEQEKRNGVNAGPQVNVFAVHGVDPEVQAYAMAKYSRSALSMKESLREISQQRSEMARMVTNGVDEDSQTIMIEALVRMKATLTRDSHPTRRVPDTRRPDDDEPPAHLPEAREAV